MSNKLIFKLRNLYIFTSFSYKILDSDFAKMKKKK